MKKFNTELKEADIRRKLALSGVSKQAEYQEIVENLETQKVRLEQDLQQLRAKVSALQEKHLKKAANQKARRVSQSANSYTNLRDELNQKYEELRMWQKKSVKALNKVAIEASYRAYMDECMSVEQQIQNSLRELKDQKKMNRRLKKAIKEHKKELNVNEPSIAEIEGENKLLKQQISELRKITDEQLTSEINVQDYLVEMKEKEKKFEQKEQDIIRVLHSELSEHPVTDLYPYLSKAEVYQVQGYLNREEKRFRTEVSVIQNRVTTGYAYEVFKEKREGSQLTFNKQFEILIAKSKLLLSNLSKLFKKKVKAIMETRESKEHNDLERNQLNSGQAEKWQKTVVEKFNTEDTTTQKKASRNRSQSKEPNQITTQTRLSEHTLEHNYKMKAILEGTITKNPNSAPRKPERRPFPHAISFANNEAQTVFNNFLDESPLRKEFIGELTEDSFTDRDLLKFEKLTTIRALHIYYTERGIAAVKAFYVVHEHNNNTSEVVTKSQVPAAYLDKHCKVYRMELLKEDFMKYLKARYNPEEGRITRIQVLSNKGIKYDFAVDRKQPEKSALETNLMEIHDTLVQRKYVFDINRNEFPVCILGTHVQRGPYWYLTAFGVEINQL